MTEAEIEKAKIGDRVKFVPLDHDAGDYCEGTITNKLGTHVEITWDDGEVCLTEANPASQVRPMVFYLEVIDTWSNLTYVGPFPGKAEAEQCYVPAQFDKRVLTESELQSNFAEFGAAEIIDPRSVID
jgi:hypothetical protein